MNTVDLVVLSVVVFVSAFLGSFYYKKIKAIKQIRINAQEEYFKTKDKYRVLTSDVFDGVEDSELTHAVLFNLLNKEDGLYEGDVIDKKMIDILNKDQLLIYTAYLVEKSTEGGRGSVHSFFIDDEFKDFIPYVDEAFTVLEAFEIVKLMDSAKQFSDAIEADLDHIEIDGDYGNYNFADYTSQLLSLLKSASVMEKAAKYIREHKESFIDKEGM